MSAGIDTSDLREALAADVQIAWGDDTKYSLRPVYFSPPHTPVDRSEAQSVALSDPYVCVRAHVYVPMVRSEPHSLAMSHLEIEIDVVGLFRYPAEGSRLQDIKETAARRLIARVLDAPRYLGYSRRLVEVDYQFAENMEQERFLHAVRVQFLFTGSLGTG